MSKACAPHCIRLRALLDVLGYGYRNGQKEFAKEIRVEVAQFNNIINGTPLSKIVAFAIFQRFEIPLEFLWFGLPEHGLQPDMERRLRDWERRHGERVFLSL